MPEPLPEHIQWLVDNRGDQLRRVLHAQDVELGVDVEPALRVFMSADPSSTWRATQWLCDTLIRGGMLWEDVAAGANSKAAETLVLFSQHRQGLPRGQRNLEDHADLGSVYAAIAPMLARNDEDSSPSGRELKRMAARAAMQASLVLCRSPDLVVAVPLSQAAAQWWGLGTRWCTAATGHNMFEHYNCRGPLVVVVIPGLKGGGGKLQMWLGDHGGMQFMDAMDRRVEHGFVHRHWSTLGPLMLWVLQRVPGALDYVPPELRTRSQYMRALPHDACMLELVPLDMRDRQMCQLAVNADPAAFKWVPDHVLSQEFCLQAIKENPLCFGSLPPRMQTPAVCLAAVQGDGKLLRHVIRKTRPICLAAVLKNGFAIKHVPLNMQDKQMCLAAISSRPSAIDMLPQELVDEDMRLEAVTCDGNVLNKLRMDHRTRPLCLAAVAWNGAMLNAVPEALRDHEMCWAALKSGGDGNKLEGTTLRITLMSIPPDVLDAQICAYAMGLDGSCLRSIPQDMRDAGLCSVAVASNGHAYSYVPGSLRTPELCMQAVQTTPRVLADLAESEKTPEACLAAVSRWGGMLNAVPPGLRTLEMCTIAVARNPSSVIYVPTELRPTVEAGMQEQPLPRVETLPYGWVADVALAGLEDALAAPARVVDGVAPQVLEYMDEHEDMPPDGLPGRAEGPPSGS